MEIEKLELVWPGKEERVPAEPGTLTEVHALGHGEAAARDNLLIRGDNLPALLALEKTHAGAVQCVYIDPPYNTGSSFAQYDDDVEHSRWLAMMRDRLEVLRRLLKPTGVIFVSIGESEAAYLKVLMDEVFGRANFCGQFIWEKKRKPSFLDANMGGVTEYVLAFARDRAQSPPFVFGVTTPGKMYPFNNAGNGFRVLTFPAGAVTFRCGDQRFEPQDMSAGRVVTELLDPVVVRHGRNAGPFRLRGEWRYAQETLDEILRRGEAILIHKAPFRPNHVKVGGAPKKIKNLLSLAHYRMSTYEDAAEESRALFGDEAAFDYPKPELLLSTLIGAVTAPGDLVLDAFAGSGTTGAVAHKLGRRWILVELGEHCDTHIVPRLRKVIDGADAGGITRACGWQGGGGFRYFRLR
jgi:adenine-specific DNA-methyltransferase